MRLNLSTAHTSIKPPTGLMLHWAQMLAEEYLVSPNKSSMWLYNHNSRKFVVDFLKNRGWKVESYTTPEFDQEPKSISHGYVIDDHCSEFVQWKLANI